MYNNKKYKTKVKKRKNKYKTKKNLYIYDEYFNSFILFISDQKKNKGSKAGLVILTTNNCSCYFFIAEIIGVYDDNMK